MDINKSLGSKNDKLNFLKGLIRVANSDGIKDNREILYYHHVATALGLNETDLEEIEKAWNSQPEDVSVEFTTDEAKMFFFVQAIQLCWVDNSYAEAEQREIRQIAKIVGISENAICEVEAWVEEGMSWNKRGEDLLNLK